MEYKQEKYISELKGFLSALYESNYTFTFSKVEDELRMKQETLIPCVLDDIFETFKIWGINSTNDWFSGEFHYSPVLNMEYWKKKPDFEIKERIMELKWSYGVLEFFTDIFLHKPYRCYRGRLGNAVISDCFYIESNGEYYYLAFGWDD